MLELFQFSMLVTRFSLTQCLYAVHPAIIYVFARAHVLRILKSRFFKKKYFQFVTIIHPLSLYAVYLVTFYLSLQVLTSSLVQTTQYLL